MMNMKGLQPITRVGPRPNFIPAPEFLIGDGSDETAALNEAATAAAAVGGVLALEGGRTYGTTAPIPSLSNFAIAGIGSKATIKLLADSQWILSPNLRYGKMTLENLVLDSNFRTHANSQGFILNDAYSMRFKSVEFRDAGYFNLSFQGGKDIKIFDCDFWGTVPGVMNVAQDPTPVIGAVYRRGINMALNCSDFEIAHNRFHFCETGLQSAVSAGQFGRNILIHDNTFRGDWWASPFITARFTVTSYDIATGIATVAGGGMNAAFPPGQYRVFAVAQLITTGTSFTSIFVGLVDSATSFANVQVGDVIETADGKRAEVESVESADAIHIRRWESIDTFELTEPPALATAFRIVRIYAMSGNAIDDTHVQMYRPDFVNTHTGYRIVTDVGSIDGATIRTYAKTDYSGVHVNGYIKGLKVYDNILRGSWADQISIFDTEAPEVAGNYISNTQDEGITITRCVGARVIGNTGKHLGVSLCFYGDSHQSTIMGNHCDTWGMINAGAQEIGGIEGAGVGVSLLGNTFKNGAAGSSYNSPIAIALRFEDASCEGTIIACNTDQGGRVASLSLASNIGQVYVRDFPGSRIIGAFKAVGLSLFSHIEMRPVSTNDIAAQVFDFDGNGKWVMFGNGNQHASANPSTAGAQFKHSPFTNFQTTRWNGSASVSETVSLYAFRRSATAGDYQLAWQDNAGNIIAWLHSDGRFGAGCPNSATNDGWLSNNMFSFYLDETNAKLKVRVRQSDGSYKTGEIPIA